MRPGHAGVPLASYIISHNIHFMQERILLQ